MIETSNSFNILCSVVYGLVGGSVRACVYIFAYVSLNDSHLTAASAAPDISDRTVKSKMAASTSPVSMVAPASMVQMTSTLVHHSTAAVFQVRRLTNDFIFTRTHKGSHLSSLDSLLNLPCICCSLASCILYAKAKEMKSLPVAMNYSGAILKRLTYFSSSSFSSFLSLFGLFCMLLFFPLPVPFL